MKRAILLRQRPGLGDICLLAPTIRELRLQRGFEKVVVVTDETYMDGGLRDTALMLPGVDDVLCQPMSQLTTEENRHYDRALGSSEANLVEFMREFYDEPGDEIFDLNTAFIKHEWEHDRAAPTAKPERHGIAEFWLRHLGLWYDGIDATPKLVVPEDARAWATERLAGDERPLLGIVLRTTAAHRDWDDDGHRKASSLLTWARTMGYRTATFDPTLRLFDHDAVPCVGERMTRVAAMVERCKAILTPDTGLLHVAQAVGTNSVSLWGSVDPRLRTMGYNTVRLPRTPVKDTSRPTLYSDARRIPFGEITDAIGAVMSL